jgi:ankyrin repeat protein
MSIFLSLLRKIQKGVHTMFGQTIITAKTTIRLFISVHFILFCSFFPFTAYTGDMTDELISASKNGDAAKVKDLVAKGVNVNEKDEYGSTALIHAVKNNCTKCVNVLIENGADVNIKNISTYFPLIIASEDGSIEIVKILLNSGADPNLKNGYEWTALMKAVVAGHVKVVEELMAKGADVSVKNEYGLTALNIAEKLEKTEMLKLLRTVEK